MVESVSPGWSRNRRRRPGEGRVHHRHARQVVLMFSSGADAASHSGGRPTCAFVIEAAARDLERIVLIQNGENGRPSPGSDAGSDVKHTVASGVVTGGAGVVAVSWRLRLRHLVIRLGGFVFIVGCASAARQRVVRQLADHRAINRHDIQVPVAVHIRTYRMYSSPGCQRGWMSSASLHVSCCTLLPSASRRFQNPRRGQRRRRSARHPTTTSDACPRLDRPSVQ